MSADRPSSPRDPADDPDRLIDVLVDRLAIGGYAVGRQQGGGRGDGRVTFVPLAAPGDLVKARVIKEEPRRALAELVSVTTPSSFRVPPPCPLFAHCGGCQWQHVDLVIQRATKREIVARALHAPLEQVAAAAPVEEGRGYRDRARFTAGENGAIGFYAWRRHAVVDVSECLLLSPRLQAALAALRATFQRAPELCLSSGSAIDMLAGREGVHVALFLQGPGKTAPAVEIERLGERLLAEGRPAGVVGVKVRRGRLERVFGLPDVDIAGPGEPALRVPAGTFAQVGAAANAALIAAVREAVRTAGSPPFTVVELHAGSGNFTRHLLADGATVAASDGDADAVARGRRFAPGASWSTRPPARIDADVVLVDPPREGLDKAALAAALQARRRIVYVSCEPSTLGRDADKIVGAGFTLRSALALDLMPHTFHTEVVVLFDR